MVSLHKHYLRITENKQQCFQQHMSYCLNAIVAELPGRKVLTVDCGTWASGAARGDAAATRVTRGSTREKRERISSEKARSANRMLTL